MSVYNYKSDSDAKPDLSFRLTHDEKARRAFIVDLKKKAKLELEPGLRARFDCLIVPRLRNACGRSLIDTDKNDRKAVVRALNEEPLYGFWGFLTYLAQGMKWDLVEDVLVHDLPRLQLVADRLYDKPNRRSSLTLNPDLPLPTNIAKTEIHRQPGGFCREAHARDIGAGARYNFGATMGPLAGRGRAGFKAGRSAGDFVAEALKARFSDFKPGRILELGCGTGRNTPAYTRQFPGAEVVAVDCAAGLLRWACAYAETQDAAVHFAQMDITRLDFADTSFDLVVSHIVGHEMTSRGLPKMIAESWRVLKPGGVMFHADVAIQPGHIDLFDQAMNQWQVRYNGEPFWMGWADADVVRVMRDLDIPERSAFVEYLSAPERGGEWFCYGARKAVE